MSLVSKSRGHWPRRKVTRCKGWNPEAFSLHGFETLLQHLQYLGVCNLIISDQQNLQAMDFEQTETHLDRIDPTVAHPITELFLRINISHLLEDIYFRGVLVVCIGPDGPGQSLEFCRFHRSVTCSTYLFRRGAPDRPYSISLFQAL